MSPRDPFAETEAQFQAKVIEYAKLRDWRAYSIPDSRRATDRGFPDVTLLQVLGPRYPVRLAFCELKTDTGTVRPDQKVWLNALKRVADAANRAAGYEVVGVYVWRPQHWQAIQDYLEGQDWPKEQAA